MNKTNRQILVVFIAVMVLDQLSKWYASAWGSVVLNRGVSFSVGGMFAAWVIAVISVCVLVGMYGIFAEYWSQKPLVYGLLSGAAISNVVDRFRLGGVQDFLPIPWIGLQNNFADWVIFFCMCWLAFVITKRSKILDERKS